MLLMLIDPRRVNLFLLRSVGASKRTNHDFESWHVVTCSRTKCTRVSRDIDPPSNRNPKKITIEDRVNQNCQRKGCLKMVVQTVLVVGATGATGKHVVQQLLDQGHHVKVIVRSEARMRQAVVVNDPATLRVKEASLLELPPDELQEQVEGTSAVVQCLGHTMSPSGIWGQPRMLVSLATRRLADAIQKSSSCNRFILMASDGVAFDGVDEPRPFFEK